MIENKYMLLESIYEFHNGAVCLTDLPEEIKEKLTTANLVKGLLKSTWKKSLKQNYGITDEGSLVEWLQYLDSEIYNQVLRSLLFDLFKENPEKFLHLTDMEIREFYSDDRLEEKIRKFTNISQEADDAKLITELYYATKNTYFENKSFFYDFFLENQQLIQLCHNYMGLGFNHLRQISIIKNAYELQYIQDNRGLELFQRVGIETKHAFDSWQEYLASVLVGKIYLSDFNGMVGTYITETEGFAKSVYQVIECFQLTDAFSEIWSDTDCQELLDFLNEKYQFDKKNAVEETSKSTIFTYQDQEIPVQYVENYAKVIEGKNAEEILPIDEKPKKKKIYRYDKELKSFINWKKILLFLVLAGGTAYFFIDDSKILGWIALVITLIYGFYLWVIGTPSKLYRNGTLAPAVVVNLNPVEVVVLAPMSMGVEKGQRWGLRTIFLNKMNDSFALGEELVCVVGYGDYHNWYYDEMFPRPLYYGFEDEAILKKAREMLGRSKVYPENIWELLPMIHEKHSNYALHETVVLDEAFNAIASNQEG